MTRQNDDIVAFATLAEGSTLVIPALASRPGRTSLALSHRQRSAPKMACFGSHGPCSGSPLELVWRNDALSNDHDPRPSAFGDEQRMQSRVIDIEPMRMLKIAWGKGDVTFTLQEQAAVSC